MEESEIIARIRFLSMIPVIKKRGEGLRIKVAVVDEMGMQFELLPEGIHSKIAVEYGIHLFQDFSASQYIACGNTELMLDRNHSWIVLPEHQLSDCSQIQVEISAITSQQQGLQVLPVRSSFVHILDEDQIHELKADSRLPAQKFWNERSLAGYGPLGTIQIKEEFGASIGSHVWDSGLVLSELLPLIVDQGELEVTNQRVLELGCGLGLPGIIAAKLGAEVTLTDKACLLALAEENCQRNNVDAGVAELSWGKEQHLEGWDAFDIILAADVLYSKDILPDLLRTITSLSHHDTVILVAQKKRAASTSESNRGVIGNENFIPLINKTFHIKKLLDRANVEVVQMKQKQLHTIC